MFSESTCDGVVCAKDGYKCVTDQYNLPTCVPLPTHCEQNPKASLQICATNDETFPSLCHMTRYNIEKGLDLRLQYHGKCRGKYPLIQGRTCNWVVQNHKEFAKQSFSFSLDKIKTGYLLLVLMNTIIMYF